MPKVILFPTKVERISLDSSYNTYNSLQTILHKNCNTVTTPAKLNIDIRSFAMTNVVFSIDWSQIPKNATITSLKLTSKGKGNRNTRPVEVAESLIELSNMTPDSIDKNIWGTPWGGDRNSIDTLAFTFTTTLQTKTISYPKMPTRQELDTLRVHYFAARGILMNKDYTVDFYGCNVEVEYTVPKPVPKIYLKNQNTWQKGYEIYKKLDNNWTLIDDISQLFDPNISYIIQP